MRNLMEGAAAGLAPAAWAPAFVGGTGPSCSGESRSWRGEGGWSAFLRFPSEAEALDDARVDPFVHGAPPAAATAPLHGVFAPLVRHGPTFATAAFTLGDLRQGHRDPP